MTDNSETPDNLKEHIASIVELTTRVDERVQGIIKQHSTLDSKTDKQLDLINEWSGRVKVLESQLIFTVEDKKSASKTRTDINELEKKVAFLETSSNNQEQRWKSIFGFAVQLIWVVLAAFLLYKMGIQSPSIP